VVTGESIFQMEDLIVVAVSVSVSIFSEYKLVEEKKFG
jgi:hypothetical protein